MFHQLVSHNDDIRRLVDKGYAIAFDSGYLIVRDIPYLDAELKLQTGALVAKYVAVDAVRVTQDDHQIWFAGAVPHGLDKKPIPNLGGGPAQLALSETSQDIVVQRRFSNKPKGADRFLDFFEKVESYIAIIAGPAMSMHDVSPLTFRTVKEAGFESVFKFHDTLTSRAEIIDLSAKFKNDVVAVIGLGGTGGFVLDFLVKTQVREIRAFETDKFFVHNAFRSPGRLDPAELGKTKAEVYLKRYEDFRTGLCVIPKFLDNSCADDLNGVTFAFVCVDRGSSRSGVFDVLLSKGIPFIDVGMGLKRQQGALNGMLRTTYYSAELGQQVRDKRLAEMADAPDDVYRTNIQISELNALNACLAVIRFKQLRGFYHAESPLFHLLFEVGDLKIVAESELDEDRKD